MFYNFFLQFFTFIISTISIKTILKLFHQFHFFLLFPVTTRTTCALGPVRNTRVVRKGFAFAIMIKVSPWSLGQRPYQYIAICGLFPVHGLFHGKNAITITITITISLSPSSSPSSWSLLKGRHSILHHWFAGYLQVYGQCKTNTSGAYWAGDNAKYSQWVFFLLQWKKYVQVYGNSKHWIVCMKQIL